MTKTIPEALQICMIALDYDPENSPPQWSKQEAFEIGKAALAASPRPAPDAGVIERAEKIVSEHHIIYGQDCYGQKVRTLGVQEASKMVAKLKAAGLLKGAEGSGDAGLREAITQIAAVCADNEPTSCDKGLALKFISDIAARNIIASIPAPVVDRATFESIAAVIDPDVFEKGEASFARTRMRVKARAKASRILALLPVGTGDAEAVRETCANIAELEAEFFGNVFEAIAGENKKHKIDDHQIALAEARTNTARTIERKIRSLPLPPADREGK